MKSASGANDGTWVRRARALVDGTPVLAVGSSWLLCELRRNVSLYTPYCYQSICYPATVVLFPIHFVLFLRPSESWLLATSEFL